MGTLHTRQYAAQDAKMKKKIKKMLPCGCACLFSGTAVELKAYQEKWRQNGEGNIGNEVIVNIDVIEG